MHFRGLLEFKDSQIKWVVRYSISIGFFVFFILNKMLFSVDKLPTPDTVRQNATF
jgi:hypothetical protein